VKFLDRLFLAVGLVVVAACPSAAIGLSMVANPLLNESDVANGYTGSVLDIGFSEPPQTDVTIEYCFDFDDVDDVGSLKANVNDVCISEGQAGCSNYIPLPLCGIDTASVLIPRGTLTTEYPIKVWINNDQLVENRESFALRLIDLTESVFDGNVREISIPFYISDDDIAAPCNVRGDNDTVFIQQNESVALNGRFPALCDDGSELAVYNVVIERLPSKGLLTYNGTAVLSGQIIPNNNLEKLVYTPALDESGRFYAEFRFQINDPAENTSNGPYSFSIHVRNPNAIPHATGCDKILNEGVSKETYVCGVRAFDENGDALTYSIVYGNDLDVNGNAPFYINSTTGLIFVNGVLDYERISYYPLLVQVSNGTNDTLVSVNVTIVDVNEAPVVSPVVATIEENAPINTIVGTVVASDPEGTTLKYEITGGVGKEKFKINAEGNIFTAAALDYETQSSYALIVTVKDENVGSDYMSTSTMATIAVTDVNEPPTATGVACSIKENTTTFVEGTNCRIWATDPEGGSLTFSIIGGNVNSTFAINPSTGVITAVRSPNYEEISAYPLVIRVSDGSGVLLVPADITVIDVNERPTVTVTNASVEENAPINTYVTWVNASDSEDGYNLTYEIIGGNEDGAFKIASSGKGDNGDGLIFVADYVIDYETRNSYNLLIKVCDRGTPGAVEDSLCVTGTVNVVVTDMNEMPFIERIPDLTIDEHTAVGIVVATVSATDPENGPLSFSFGGGNDGLPFAINSSTGIITVNEDIEFDDLVTNPFVIRVDATDADGLRAATVVTITINEIEDEKPLDIVSRWCATYYGDASAYYGYGTEWCLYNEAELYERIPIYVSVLEDGWSVDLQRAAGRQYTLNLEDGLVAYTDQFGYEEMVFPRTIDASGIDTVWLYYDVSYENNPVAYKYVSLGNSYVELQFHTYYWGGLPSVVEKSKTQRDGTVKFLVSRRELRISGAPAGYPYAVLDMQGRIVSRGVSLATGVSVQVPHAGTYLVRIGGRVHRVRVK